MPKLKIETMKSLEFDHDWHDRNASRYLDLTLFEKLPIKNKGNTTKKKRDAARKHRRSAKSRRQEYLLGTHGRQHS